MEGRLYLATYLQTVFIIDPQTTPQEYRILCGTYDWHPGRDISQLWKGVQQVSEKDIHWSSIQGIFPPQPRMLLTSPLCTFPGALLTPSHLWDPKVNGHPVFLPNISGQYFILELRIVLERVSLLMFFPEKPMKQTLRATHIHSETTLCPPLVYDFLLISHTFCFWGWGLWTLNCLHVKALYWQGQRVALHLPKDWNPLNLVWGDEGTPGFCSPGVRGGSRGLYDLCHSPPSLPWSQHSQCQKKQQS